MYVDYNNFISLGYFCEVAQDLEKLGLRSFSSPFDWGISNFPCVIKAIANRFDGFLEYRNLLQSDKFRSHYFDDQYCFFSFHDFSAYTPLDKQYQSVHEKYMRRINSFLSAIESPTLFFRYVSSEIINSDNKSIELLWIEENYSYILETLKSYNNLNNIIFIGDEMIQSDSLKIYHVSRDINDTVSRSPIISNAELLDILSDFDYPQREANLEHYLVKEAKKNRYTSRINKDLKWRLQSIFLKEYIHSRVLHEEDE